MTSDSEQRVKYLKILRDEEESIEDQVFSIATWSSGGISLEDAANLSYLQREKIAKMLGDKLKKMSGDTREYL
jgi:hypothetical protein